MFVQPEFSAARRSMGTFEATLIPFEQSHTGTSTGDWSSLIGIITAIVGNVLISFALNTQRYAHIRLEREWNKSDEKLKSDRRNRSYGSLDESRQNGKPNATTSDDFAEPPRISEDYGETDALLSGHPKDDQDEERSINSQSSRDSGSSQRTHYLRSPWWWLGISLMVIGEAGNFLAYGFAPASIVSPLGVVALIFNCLIAPIMLHEKFRKQDLLGVLIAIGGAVTVVLTAKGSNPKLGPHEIWDLISRWEFETYFGVTMGLIVILMAASSRYGDRTIAIDIGLVGLFGGYTALSTKGVASLLSYKFWHIVTFPISYLLVGVLVATAVMQIKYINRALQRFDSTQVIPAQFVTFTISVIVGSAILYRDFESTTVKQMVQFVGGCALTFLGVWVITSGRQSRDNGNDHHQGDESDEEDGRIVMVDEEARQDVLDNTLSAPTTPRALKPLPSFNVEDSPNSFTTAQSFAGTPQGIRLHNTTSSPLLPTQSQLGTPRLQPLTPADTPAVTTSTRRNRPTVIGREVSDGVIAFDTPPRHSSRFLRARPSVSDILPQAFTSPLSGGLSSIVAEAQRREAQRDILRRNSSQRSRARHGSRTNAMDVFGADSPAGEGRSYPLGAELGTSVGSISTEVVPERRDEEAASERGGPSRTISNASRSSAGGR